MHERVELAFPPLVERGRAGCCRCRSKDNVKKRYVIDGRFRAKIKTHRSRKQHEQSEPRLDQFGEIRSQPPSRGHKIRVLDFERGGFHATNLPVFPNAGAAGPAVAGRSTRRYETCQQIAEMLTPKDSMIAPTATCAVATSAALLLQIVQAPSAIWQVTSTTQNIASLLSAAGRGTSGKTRTENAITAIAMMNARNRCAICNQIWNAVTSDKPRASRHALTFARAATLVSGIHAPFAVGKSRTAKSRCSWRIVAPRASCT